MYGLRPRDVVAPRMGPQLGRGQVLQRGVPPAPAPMNLRRNAARAGTLAIILGDQLDPRSPALVDLDPTRDTLLLVEAPGGGGARMESQGQDRDVFRGDAAPCRRVD